MSRIVYIIILFVSCVLPLRSWAQEMTFEFEDELCKYIATYDSNKYTEEQLFDTYKLVQGYYNLYTNDEEQLEDNYAIIKKELADLQLVITPYFKTLRDSVLHFLELTYKVKKAEFAARKGNKEDLLKFYTEDANVKMYAESLNKGGEELIKAYEYLTKQQMKSNGSPERLWSEYLKNIKSSNAQYLAFDYVLTYGWWNAVNNQLPHVNNDGTQFVQFKNLFIKVETVDCDEV